MPDLLDAMFRRRSIRKFTDQPVEREILVSLLQAAMAAPSAVNSQPWEFVVITEPEALAKLRGRLLFGRYKAPAAIAVLGNPGIAHNPAGRQFWEQDCSAATENILLAAVALGLGAVWIGVHPIAPVVSTVREVLNLPSGVTPLCLVYVGYPAEEKPPRTQYEERRVHWQIYEPRKPRLKLKNAKLR